eukprot:10855532-Alexandrium_andersonii.AAC.1
MRGRGGKPCSGLRAGLAGRAGSPTLRRAAACAATCVLRGCRREGSPTCASLGVRVYPPSWGRAL